MKNDDILGGLVVCDECGQANPVGMQCSHQKYITIPDLLRSKEKFSGVDNFIGLMKSKRIEQDMSLNDVAVIVDHSKTHIWDLENGVTSNPSFSLVLKLSVLFDINLNDFK